jgi:hypothetical protein
MKQIAVASVLLIAVAAVPALAQQPVRCPSPPVVVLGAPVPDVTPFQGGRYSFHQPGVFSNSYYQPSYTAPRTYYPRYPNPGPYYYTPAYSFTPGYYSYYYTPGYFRY